MEVLYKASLEDHYSELAQHYRERGNTAQAVEGLHLAGQHAVLRSANADAVRSLTSTQFT